MAPFNLSAEVVELAEVAVVADAEVDRETILGAGFGNRAIEVVRVSLNRMRIMPLMRLIAALFRTSNVSLVASHRTRHVSSPFEPAEC
jgi:hypothetical protein